MTANGKVVSAGLFDQILIPPAPHDAGCAVGAAWMAEIAAGTDSSAMTMPHPYLGVNYSADAIGEAFETMGLPVPERLDEEDLIDRTAHALANREIIAWFQGASEFGPRALGCRSFLADPRADEIREINSLRVTGRTSAFCSEI